MASNELKDTNSYEWNRNGATATSDSESWTQYFLGWLSWSSKSSRASPNEQRTSPSDVKVSRVDHGVQSRPFKACHPATVFEQSDSGMIWVKQSESLDKAIQSASRSSRQLPDYRLQLNLIRSQRSFETEKARDKFRFLDESIRIVAMTSLIQARSQPQGSDVDIASIVSQLTEDWREFSDQWKAVLQFESILSTKEYQIDRVETKLLSSVKFFLDQFSQSDMGRVADDVDTTSTASEIVPETARRLFEKSGHLVALEEQIQRLESDHYHERQRRELVREQDGEPSTSDEEFEYQYRNERQRLEAECENLRAEMEVLRVQCQQEGIDLRGFGAFEPTGSLSSPDGEGISIIHDGHSFSVISDAPKQEAASNSLDIGPAVEGWLDRVEVGSDSE